MPVSQQRLTEIAAISDGDIDTSEIPEADEAWFKGAKLVLPQEAKITAESADDVEAPGSPATELEAATQPRRHAFPPPRVECHNRSPGAAPPARSPKRRGLR